MRSVVSRTVSQARRGRAAILLLAGVGGVALIAAALMLGGSAAPTVPPVVMIPSETPTAEDASAVQLTSAPAQAAAEPIATPATFTEEVAPSATASAISPADIDGYLAAGEFGNAADAVAAVPTEEDRQKLLERVIFAQIEGDAATPVGLVAQLGEQQGPARAAAARRESLSGGFGADFDALIELIQSETEGPWFENDGIGGTISEFESGIRVDAAGLLSRVAQKDVTNRLAELGHQARAADLHDDMSRPSTLRFVSLTRLERAVAERLQAGKSAVESMKNLAGLSEIRYVLIDEEQGEILLGGPAEGWMYDETGMPVGTTSGRPTLQLDDLVTVLRTFSHEGMSIFGCSIDPRPEGLAKVQDFVNQSQSRGPLDARAVRGWAKQIGEVLGRQDISIYGVPAHSRVARVLVEADYRMKLIGLGKLDGGSEIPSYFDLLAKNPSLATGSLDALRWWLTINCEQVLHSPDRSAFEIRGSSVQCQSENQFLTDTGKRVATGKSEPINREFASNFTEHYEQLAERDPIFADLQGVFDLSLVAAMLHREGLDARVGWNRGVFAVNGAYRTSAFPVPAEVDSVVNHRVYNGRDVVVQVAGGVRADVFATLTEQAQQTESDRLDGVVAQARPQSDLPAGRWWWDAK